MIFTLNDTYQEQKQDFLSLRSKGNENLTEFLTVALLVISVCFRQVQYQTVSPVHLELGQSPEADLVLNGVKDCIQR